MLKGLDEPGVKKRNGLPKKGRGPEEKKILLKPTTLRPDRKSGGGRKGRELPGNPKGQKTLAPRGETPAERRKRGGGGPKPKMRKPPVKEENRKKKESKRGSPGGGRREGERYRRQLSTYLMKSPSSEGGYSAQAFPDQSEKKRKLVVKKGWSERLRQGSTRRREKGENNCTWGDYCGFRREANDQRRGLKKG